MAFRALYKLYCETADDVFRTIRDFLSEPGGPGWEVVDGFYASGDPGDTAAGDWCVLRSHGEDGGWPIYLRLWHSANSTRHRMDVYLSWDSATHTGAMGSVAPQRNIMVADPPFLLCIFADLDEAHLVIRKYAASRWMWSVFGRVKPDRLRRDGSVARSESAIPAGANTAITLTGWPAWAAAGGTAYCWDESGMDRLTITAADPATRTITVAASAARSAGALLAGDLCAFTAGGIDWDLNNGRMVHALPPADADGLDLNLSALEALTLPDALGPLPATDDPTPRSTADMVLETAAGTARGRFGLARHSTISLPQQGDVWKDAGENAWWGWYLSNTKRAILLGGVRLDAARQALHLRRRPAPAARQCLLLWRGSAYAPRQCLHLLREPLPMPRQCLHLLRDALPAARQCLHLQRDICPAARQALHLLRDGLPVARQCLHLKRDKYPLTRRCLHLLRNAEYAVSPATAVTIAGTPVSPIAIRVTESADQAAITATLEFAEALPPGLGPPAPVIIELFGIRYVLLGENYSRSREFGSRSWTLTAASPAYRLQSRYADDVSGELVGMASSIARALTAPSPGGGGPQGRGEPIPIDWRMVDWQVQPGRLSPTGQAPLDVIRDLVSAAGGRLTSARDGCLVAMPWPPLRPEDWPAHIEAETDSLSAMISISDDADARDLRNAVTVSDEAGTGDLRIEEIPETRIGGRAEVWVYQVPWQDDFDTRHTAAGWAVLQDLGVEERAVEEEMLEIVDGRGKTQHPIYGIVAARWNKIDLGAVTPAEDGTITTEIAAESLLYLTYKTKARRLLVEMREANPEPIMLIAED